MKSFWTRFAKYLPVFLGIVGWMVAMVFVGITATRVQQNKKNAQSVALFSNMYISREPYGKGIAQINRHNMPEGFWLMYDIKHSVGCVVDSYVGLRMKVNINNTQHLLVWPMTGSDNHWLSAPTITPRRVAYYVQFQLPSKMMLPVGDYSMFRLARYDCNGGDPLKVVPIWQTFNFKVVDSD